METDLPRKALIGSPPRRMLVGARRGREESAKTRVMGRGTRCTRIVFNSTSKLWLILHKETKSTIQSVQFSARTRRHLVECFCSQAWLPFLVE